MTTFVLVLPAGKERTVKKTEMNVPQVHVSTAPLAG